MSGIKTMSAGQDQQQSGPSSTVAELHDRLDSLWMSYLRNLDEYTIAQKVLQDRLRAGFFSLSRSNFNARPGMRFGGDYFHDRAVATRRVTTSQDHVDDTNGRVKLQVAQHSVIVKDDDSGSESEKATAGEGVQQPSPPATPDAMDEKKETSTKDKQNLSDETQGKTQDSSTHGSKCKLPLEADPLRWFGILVPQELRSAQASFSSFLDDSVGQAVNASRAMRENEVDIRKLRKEIRRAEKAEKS